MGKHDLTVTDKIFIYIMKFNKFGIYKWINRHPKISISILILIAVLILYIFVGFIIKRCLM